jgi:1,4-dihydroxy-2-naphthoate octaprenyltransferase
MATAAQWIEGARPRTLPAAIAPVLAGSGVALYEFGFCWWRALLALAVSLLLQVGVNYANDYSDGIRGTDDDRVGPMRLVGSGLARPEAVKAAAFTALGAAAVAGLALAVSTSWWLVLVGALSILAAWFYTGGKHPYGYLGLGEVMVFVFFGLVAVLGTVYVQLRDLPGYSWWVGVGIGVLACAILVANNLRDIPTDIEAGKRTLAVKLGEVGTRRFYAILVVISLVAIARIAIATTPWTCLGLVCVIPLALATRTVVTGARGPALIPVLQQTGIGELLYAVGLFAGLWIGR